MLLDASKRNSYESSVDKIIDTDAPIAAEVFEEFRYRIGKEASQTLDDDDIRRFLGARGGSMLKGAKMAKDTNEWKHTLMPPTRPRGLRFSPNIILANPDLLANHEAVQWIPASHHGYDKEGAPVYWERTGYVQCNFSTVKKYFSVDELVQYHIQSMEANELRYEHASTKFGSKITQSVTVFDMKHLTMALDADSIKYIKTILGTDQGNYPERLKHLFLINAPWYIHLLYKIFLPFIDARTAAKFVILDEDYMPTITQHIDIANIPIEMGGEAKVFWSGNFTDDSGVSDNQIRLAMSKRYGQGKAKDLLRPEEQEALRKAVAVAVETGLFSADENYLSPGGDAIDSTLTTTASEESVSVSYVPADHKVMSAPIEGGSWSGATWGAETTATGAHQMKRPREQNSSSISSSTVLKITLATVLLSVISVCIHDTLCISVFSSLLSLHTKNLRTMLQIYTVLVVVSFFVYMYYACAALLKNFKSVCSFC